MANKEVTESDLDLATIKARLATKLLQGTRAAAQAMSIPSGVWMHALLEEAAVIITTQREADASVEGTLTLVKDILTELVEVFDTNPRIEGKVEVVMVPPNSVEREADDLIARFIGKVQR